MKTVGGIRYLKIGEVAALLGKTPQTIRIWYKYKKEHPQINIQLPETYILDKRGSRYFKEEDFDKLKHFNDSMVYGGISDMTVRLWGKRGKNVKRRLDRTEEFVNKLNFKKFKKQIVPVEAIMNAVLERIRTAGFDNDITGLLEFKKTTSYTNVHNKRSFAQIIPLKHKLQIAIQDIFVDGENAELKSLFKITKYPDSYGWTLNTSFDIFSDTDVDNAMRLITASFEHNNKLLLLIEKEKAAKAKEKSDKKAQRDSEEADKGRKIKHL